MTMVIDCHCHAGQGDGFTGPWDTDAPLHAYLQRAARAGIARTVLLPASSSASTCMSPSTANLETA